MSKKRWLSIIEHKRVAEMMQANPRIDKFEVANALNITVAMAETAKALVRKYMPANK